MTFDKINSTGAAQKLMLRAEAETAAAAETLLEAAAQLFPDSNLGALAHQAAQKKTELFAQLAHTGGAQGTSGGNSTSAATPNPLNFLTQPKNVADAKLFDAGGAFFNKQMAVKPDAYAGIAQRIQLPQVAFDPSRFYIPRSSSSGGGLLGRVNDFHTAPLDKPSVYLGGTTAKRHGVNGEMDIGLTYDRVYNKGGEATFTTNPAGSDMRNAADRFTIKKENGFYVAKSEDGTRGGKMPIKDFEAQLAQAVAPDKTTHLNREVVIKMDGLELRPNFAFRPTERANFKPGAQKTKDDWYNPPKDAAGLRAAQTAGRFKDANDSNVQNKYYYPGETVSMSLKTAGKDRANLTISRDGGAAASETYSHDFGQQGLGAGAKWQPKTVISIDQFTVDTYGNRVGTECRGKPNQHARRKDDDGKYVGGVYSQGVQATQTKLTGARILSSMLLSENGKNDAPIAGRGFYEVRGSELRDRGYDRIFEVTDANPQNGARTLNITPANIGAQPH